MHAQSYPRVGLPHGLGSVGLGWVEIFRSFVGWVGFSIAVVLKFGQQT